MSIKQQEINRTGRVLKLSTMAVAVAALSGCGEDFKDCGGFWDKTFGRDGCAVAVGGETDSKNKVFGPISNAQVMVSSPLNQAQNLLPAVEKTDGNGDFVLEKTLESNLKADEFYLLSVVEGDHLDVNGDGKVDSAGVANKGSVRSLVKGSQLVSQGLNVSLLTDIAWRYSSNHLADFSNRDIETRLSDVAKIFFIDDISGDQSIDYKDLSSFDPTKPEHLKKLAFQYQFLFDDSKGGLIKAYLANDDEKIEMILDDLFGLRMSRFQGKDSRSEQVKIEVLPFGKGSYSSADGKITYASDGSVQKLHSFYDKANGYVTITANPDTDTQILDWSGCHAVSEDKTKCQVSTLSDKQVIVSFGYKEAKIVDNFLDLSRAASSFDGNSKIHVTINHGDDELVAAAQKLTNGYYITGLAEYGYLRKITGITRLSDYKYTFETEEASLEEVVQQGTAHFSKQFTGADLEGAIQQLNDTQAKQARSSLNYNTPKQAEALTPATPLPRPKMEIVSQSQGVRLIPKPDGDDQTFTIQFGPDQKNARFLNGSVETKEFEITDPDSGLKVKLKGTLNFDLKLDIGVDYSWGKLESFKAVADLDMSQKLEATFGGDFDFEKACKERLNMKDGCQVELFTMYLNEQVVPVGVVPVYFSTVVKFYIGLDGKITAKSSTDLTLKENLKGGAVYAKNTGWNYVGELDFSHEFTAPTVEAGFEVTPYIKPVPMVLFYRYMGPTIPLKGYLKIKGELFKDDITSDADIWKDNLCSGGLDITAILGFSAKIGWEFGDGNSNKLAKFLESTKVLNKAELEFFRNEVPVYEKNIGGTCKQPAQMVIKADHISDNIVFGDNTILSYPYIIENSGDESLDWTVEYVPDGILSIEDNAEKKVFSGKLDPRSSQKLTVKIDPSKIKEVGSYTNKIKFAQDDPNRSGFFIGFIKDFLSFNNQRNVNLNVSPISIPAPTQLKAELFKPTISKLSWDYSSTEKYANLTKGYRVYMSENGKDWDIYQTITDLNQRTVLIPNLLTNKTYYFAVDAYADHVQSKHQQAELFIPRIQPQGDCRAHFTGGLMADHFWDGGISEVYVEDAYSEYVGPGLYPDSTQAFPKAVATTFDGIAIDAGTKVTIYSEKDFKGTVLYEAIGPAIINNSIWRGYDIYGPPVERDWKEPLQSLYPQAVRKWSDGNMHDWSYGSLMVECGYTKSK